MRDRDTNPENADPIAVTLAIWLAMIVLVTGFARVSNEAQIHAALWQGHRSGTAVSATDEELSASMQMMAFGG